MRSAKIALFEYDPSTRNQIRGAVNHPATGHRVVSEAPSLGAAMHVVSLMRQGYREVDAVILGADFSPEKETGKDALIVVNGLRALDVTPKIIGCASVPFAELGVSVDGDILKEEFFDHPEQLNKLIAEL